MVKKLTDSQIENAYRVILAYHEKYLKQARHLGMQKGWFIAAGGRDNRDVKLDRGEYQLLSLEKPYPAFHGHKVESSQD